MDSEYNGELDINLGIEETIQNLGHRKLPKIFAKSKIEKKKPFPIFVNIDVWYSIQNHLNTSTKNEVGGVLVGGYYFDQNTCYLDIVGSVEANNAVENMTSITFTHKTWDHVNGVIAKKYCYNKIVGWYHSHPNYGIFLSKDDFFIHNNFFKEKHQVALVADPVNKEYGFFQWSNNQLKLYRAFYLYSSVKRIHELINYAYRNSKEKNRLLTNIKTNMIRYSYKNYVKIAVPLNSGFYE